MTRQEKLANQAFDGGLSIEECQELEDLCRPMDAQALEALEQLRMDAMLVGMFADIDVTESVVTQLKQENADQIADRVMQTLRRRKGQKFKKALWGPVLAVAATVMITLGLVVVKSQRPPALGVLTQISETLQLERDGGFEDLSVGTVVRAGDQLILNAIDPVSLRLTDGSQLILGKNAVLTLNASESETVLALHAGWIDADLNSQLKPFLITTPVMTVKVVGTVFRVEHDDAQRLSAVKVVEGEVQVITDGAGELLNLTAGQSMSATSEQILTYPRITRRVWDFEKLPVLDLEAQGVRIPAEEAPQENGSGYCLKSLVAPKGTENLPPQAWGPVFLNPQDGLFRSEEGGVLRFKYYVDEDCRWLGIHLRSESSDDSYYVDLERIGYNRWQEVEVPLSSFTSNSSKHPLSADILIHRLQIQTNAEVPTLLYLDDIRLEK